MYGKLFFRNITESHAFSGNASLQRVASINKTTAVWENSGGAGVALGEMSVRGEFTALRVQNKGNPVDYKKKYNARVSRALFFSS